MARQEMARQEMAEQRKIRRKANQKKPAGKQRRRLEHRFLPRTTTTGWALFGCGMLGALALGAGVFGQWVNDPPVEYALYLLLVGAVGLGVALWFGELSAVPVRIGDAGVALEKGTELVRLGWCDMESVTIEKNQLFVKTTELSFAIPIAAHPQAVDRKSTRLNSSHLFPTRRSSDLRCWTRRRLVVRRALRRSRAHR